jgi:outer membrane protein OmpA-like peptidoglycan-associated protein
MKAETRTGSNGWILPATALALLLAGASMNPVQAEEQHFGQRVPSVDEFVDALKPTEELRMRGIRPVNEVVEERTVSMQLQFEFDSAELTPESKKSLDNLSAALKSDELGTFNFVIEGHTDAVGTEQYNMSLSQLRADAVRRYLTAQHRVPAERLRTVGYGEQKLFDESNPADGVNRRVAIRNAGAAGQ